MKAPSNIPSKAMILAAGLGIRMRPLTDSKPKPMIKVQGRSLIEYNLASLLSVGVMDVIVNVHYLSEQMISFLSDIDRPTIYISDEQSRLLDSGGGLKKALPYLGNLPFYVLNSDSFWLDGATPNLKRLADAWDSSKMDILLMLAAGKQITGYTGNGDFMMDATGCLSRRPEKLVSPFVYAGVAILKPELFDDTPDGPFSLNLLFDRAIETKKLYGLRLDGDWFHVGTPDSIADAEDRLLEKII